MTAPQRLKFSGHRIIANPSGMSLAEDLAEELGVEIESVECSAFPDKTCGIRIPDSLREKHVILVGQITSNDELVEVGLLQNALRCAKVESITTVVPYFFYGRQDRGRNGEPLGARWMASAIGNTDRVIVVDPHKDNVLGFFLGRAYGTTCTRELGEWLQDKAIDLVLAPDEGALPRAKALGEFLGVPFDNYEKERLSEFHVSVKPKRLAIPGVGGRVAIVDDIISTADTMIAAAKAAKEAGASYVIAICTHGIFVGDALKRLEAVCDKVVSTDTVSSDAAQISCTPAIARVLRTISHL